MKKEKIRYRISLFTLMEMVVTISIILMMIGIAIPAYNKIQSRAKTAKANAQIQNFVTAIATFELDMGHLPKSLDDLVQNPGSGKKWHGPYLQMKSIPKDPWQHDYVYQSPGKNGDADSYDIISYGSDGAPGGTGSAADIDNWPGDDE